MKKINKIYYFAYGSNISQERLEWRVGKVKYIKNATLDDYELNLYFQGFANIEPKLKRSVEGSLYELTLNQLSILDRYEGLYQREYFTIGDVLVVTYIGRKNCDYYMIPDRDYLQVIMYGCLEKNIKSTYNLCKKILDSLPIKKKRKLRF